MTDSNTAVLALAHRIAWRYKKSGDPAHSDTYTFNEATLLQFAAALRQELVNLRSAALAGAEALEYLGGTLHAQRLRDAAASPPSGSGG